MQTNLSFKTPHPQHFRVAQTKLSFVSGAGKGIPGEEEEEDAGDGASGGAGAASRQTGKRRAAAAKASYK